MTRESRTCVVKIPNMNPFDAVFHGWGNDVIESHQENLPITVGIVEAEDGQVHLVGPDRIKFNDLPPKGV